MLRDGITVAPAPPTRNGRRACLLFDPLRHRYFRFEAEALRQGGAALARRLQACELAAPADPAASRDLAGADAARRPSWWQALAHRYLFVRVPLLRPDALLDDLLPLARPLMTRAASAVIGLLAALAVLLLVRHLDPFVAALPTLASPEGAAATIVSLVFVKSLHELAHALALKRRGGRVPTFGVAFVVLFPVLYTDTSDAWRLPRARHRLAVDLAGVRVELAVAVLATLAWIVLPDGSVRLAALSLAAVSWIMSLAVNLNPFMRFDGYHVLADALDLPNMQERAFALARWRLREGLFAPGEAPPERLPRALRRTLIVYAALTWIYRLVVFTGIAVLVYQTTFKALGLVLFAVEIWWFVLRPVTREAAVWARTVRERRTRPRTWMPLAVLFMVVVLLALPLDDSLTLPATLQNGTAETVHAPRAARLAALHARDGEVVEAGVVLATLAAPELAFERERLDARHAAALAHLRTARLGDDERSARRRLAVVRERLAAHARDVERLTLRAPRNGTVVLARDVQPSRTVAVGAPLLTVIGEGRTVVAYAGQRERPRLDDVRGARFVPDDPTLPAAPLLFTAAADLPLARLALPENAARHGGGVRADGEGAPLEPTFRARFTVPAALPAAPPGRYRGVVHVDVAPRSLGWQAVLRVWGVLLRESGF